MLTRNVFVSNDSKFNMFRWGLSLLHTQTERRSYADRGDVLKGNRQGWAKIYLDSTKFILKH